MAYICLCTAAQFVLLVSVLQIPTGFKLYGVTRSYSSHSFLCTLDITIVTSAKGNNFMVKQLHGVGRHIMQAADIYSSLRTTGFETEHAPLTGENARRIVTRTVKELQGGNGTELKRWGQV